MLPSLACGEVDLAAAPLADDRNGGMNSLLLSRPVPDGAAS
jgi:hypothetical protein